MIKGLLKSIAAPVFTGVVAGNVFLYGSTLFTNDAAPISQAQDGLQVSAIFLSMAAAGATGYLLGKKTVNDTVTPPSP
ncbi:MAG: hypothetical protein ACEPO2_05520 [Pelagibaca sp.]